MVKTEVGKRGLQKLIATFMPQGLPFFGGAIAGLAMAFHPTWFSHFTLVQGDAVDTLLNHYILEHSFQVLVKPDYIGTAWSPAFFYPTQNVLAFGDNLWGTAPLYWILRAFYPVDPAYSLWLMGNCLLCYGCFWVLLRYLEIRPILATLGALIFGFGIPRITDIMHPQLLPQGFMVIAFLCLWRFLNRPHIVPLALCGLLTIGQILAGIYLGWFWIWSALLFTGLTLLLLPSIRWRLFNYLYRSWLSTSLVLGGTGIAMLWLLLPYLRSSQQLGPRPYIHVHISLPQWQDWFTAPSHSLWAILLPVSSAALPSLFNGMVIFFLSIGLVGAWLFQRSQVARPPATAPRSAAPSSPRTPHLAQICSVTILILLLVSLRWPSHWLNVLKPVAEIYPFNAFLANYPYNQSFWSIVYALIPGAKAIRAVGRIWTVIYFYWLIAVMLGTEFWLTRWHHRRKLILGLISVLLSLSIMEQVVVALPADDPRPFRQDVEDLAQLFQSSCQIGYVWPTALRSHDSGRRSTIQALNQLNLMTMWAGLQANVPVVNGSAGNAPAHYREFQSLEDVLQWLAPTSAASLCLVDRDPESIPMKSLQSYPQVTSPRGRFVARIIQLT